MNNFLHFKIKNAEWYRILFFSIIILFFVLLNIRKLNLIYVVGDEFGYWANAASFVGLDWSGVASLNPYYSYGWSLFLAPLFWITHNPAILYKMAISLNALFLVGSFILAYSCAKKWFPYESHNKLLFCTFAITLYSNNIFQSQTCQSEIALVVMVWLIVWLLSKCIIKTSVPILLALGAATIYTYLVHMRCIGICICVAVITTMVLFNKEKSRKIVHFMLPFLVIFAFSFMVKNFLLNKVYINEQLVSVNDYSGQLGKLELLFSIRGLCLFFLNFIGRIFYIGASTFFIAYWGFISMIKKSINLYKTIRNKDKNWEITDIIAFFVLLSYLATVVISSIYMIDISQGRLDTLIYGRYTDILTGPIILFGFLEFINYRKRLHNLKFYAIIVFHITSAILVYLAVMYFELKELFPNNVSGIVSLMYSNGRYANQNFSYIVSVKIIAIAVLMEVLLYIMPKPIKNGSVIFIAICMWLYCGYDNSNINTYKYQISSNDYLISQMINKIDPEAEVYFLHGEQTNSWTMIYIDYIQFLLPDIPIKVRGIEELGSVPETAYLTIGKDEDYNTLHDTYFSIAESNRFTLYAQKEIRN